jgi:2-haloacid dehalogenase
VVRARWWTTVAVGWAAPVFAAAGLEALVCAPQAATTATVAAIPSTEARRGAMRQVQHTPTARSPVRQDLSMPAIEAVVFDIGGVLLDWDPRYVYRELFDDEAEMERFLSQVCSREWHEDNDRGVLYADSCAALAARHPDYEELIWTWGRRTEDMIGGPIEGTVAVLAELQAAGVPCYGLTNMEAETYPRRVERFAFLQGLVGTVVSSAEGVIKPDPEIFRRLLSRFALVAERTVFVDDSEVNVAAAAALGMVALRFVSPASLRADLVALGLPVSS